MSVPEAKLFQDCRVNPIVTTNDHRFTPEFQLIYRALFIRAGTPDLSMQIWFNGVRL